MNAPVRHARHSHGMWLFDSPADFFDAMHAPHQHDFHVRARRGHLVWEGKLAQARRADEGLRQWMRERGMKV